MIDEKAKEYERKKEICDCKNLLAELLESKKFTVKDGTIFNKESGKYLGTIYQLYKEKQRE